MFETAGAATILEPARALVLLLLLPLVGLLLARTRHAARAAIVSSGALVVLAGLVGFRLATLPPGRALVSPAVPLARIGQLDLSLGLSVDGADAALLAVGSVLSLAAVLQSVWTRTEARLPWIQLLTSGVVLVVASDGLLVVGAGLALSTVATWGLSRAEERKSLGAAFASDAAFALGVALLFWALGGAFGPAGYTPDAQPRFAVIAKTNARAPEGKTTVSMTTYAGALVVSENGPALPGEPFRAPFETTLEPGTYSFRVQAGVASQDAIVSHVSLATGRAYVLTPFGPTTSVRNLGDQARVARPSIGGDRSLRATLGARLALGVRAGAWVAALLLLAPLVRLARVASGRAVALEALVPISLAVRVAPLVDPGPVVALLAAVVAAVLAGRAAASRAPGEALGGVLAANAAIAVAAATSGEVGAALVIASSALVGAAAADAAQDGGEVRWLGVACAAMTGLIPAAGVSTGIATAVGAALASRAPLALALAVLVLVASALASLAAFRVYDASIGRAAGRRLPALAGLAAVLGLLALQVGAVLGAGTSPFGGSVAPLVRRVAPSGVVVDGTPRLAVAALAAAVAMAIAGAFLARRRKLALEALLLPSRAVVRVAAAFGGASGFLARSVRALDRDVVEDAGAALASALLRVGGAVRRVEARAASGAWDRLASATAPWLGGPRVRSGILLVMVALLGLVVLSSIILGR